MDKAMKVQRGSANPLARFGMVATLGLALIAPQLGYSQEVDEDPSALAMAGDLIIARPVGLVVTVVGAAAYLVSLPFSLAGGNARKAGETLVVGPAMTTFVRCLGCTKPGYTAKRTYTEESAE